MKAEIASREEAMADTSSVVKIKEAMGTIKAEISDMELKIGVSPAGEAVIDAERRSMVTAVSGTQGPLPGMHMDPGSLVGVWCPPTTLPPFFF